MKNRIKHDIKTLEIAISNMDGTTTESKYSDIIQSTDSINTLPSDILPSGIIGNITGNLLYNYIFNNSDLSNGITSLGTINSTISVNNQILQVTGTNNKLPIVFYNMSPSSGKWFLSARVRVRNSVASSIKLMMQTNTNGSEVVAIIDKPIKDKWYNLYGTITIPPTSTITQVLQLGHEYIDSTTATGQVMEVEGNFFRGGGLYAIPLTGTQYETWEPNKIFSILGNSINKVNNVNGIRVRTTGSNIFNGKITNGGLNNLTGGETPDNTKFRTGFMRVKPNTSYIITGLTGSYIVFFYNKNREFIEYGLSLGITPINAAFMRLHFNIETYTDDVMINMGEIALPHDDYSESEIYYSTELNALSGDILDEFTFNGIHTKRIGKLTNATGIVNYDDMLPGGKFIAFLSNGIMQCGVKGDTLQDIAEKIYYQLTNPIISKYTCSNLIVEPNGHIYIDHVYKDSSKYGNGIIIDNKKFKYIDRVIKIDKDNGDIDITDKCSLNINKNGIISTYLNENDIISFTLVPEDIGLIPILNYSYPTNLLGAIESNTKNINEINNTIDNIMSILENSTGGISGDINIDGGIFN